MKNLVMIPAMGCDGRLYAGIAELLAAYVTPHVIVVDGNDLAECVFEVLRQAPDKFIILGTSFGGTVALEVALAASDRVEGLVVIGAGAGPAANPAAGLNRAERLRGGVFETVVTEMADMVSHLPGPHGATTRELFTSMARDGGGQLMARQSTALARRSDLWPRLGEILVPSLMLWGREDQFSPAADGLKLSTAIANARYAEISECGHFPSLEAPEETADILLHWLQDMKLT